MSIKLLQESYHDATRKGGLIDFTKKIRTEKNDSSGKFSVKESELSRLFSKPVWDELSTKSGHRKIKNKITDVVVEYANHNKDIDPGAAQTIFEAVQNHLNILNNDIFSYKSNNWKTNPDYQVSEHNLIRRRYQVNNVQFLGRVLPEGFGPR